MLKKKKNKTTKKWVEEELSKLPIKKIKNKKDTKETVKMSRKAGLFFLR